MPTQALTDFRCYLPGRIPDEWPPAFGATSAPFLVKSTDPDPPEAARLVCTPTAASVVGLSWSIAEEIAGDGLHEDQEVVFKFKLADGGFQRLAALRLSGASAAAANAYYLRIDALATDLNVEVWKVLAGTATRKGRTTLPVGLGWNWARFRCEYNAGPVSLSVSVWPDGATEPGAWDLTVSDASSTVPDGGIGLLSAATVGYEIDTFGWAVDGGTAPGAESVKPSLSELLASGSALAYTTRVESYDLATQAEMVDWYCHAAARRGTHARDYPANKHFDALLISAGSDTDELAEDGIFGGIASRQAASVTYLNKAGQFRVRARTYAGRRHTLYVGDAALDHVWHVPISTAVLASEPGIRPQEDKATFDLSAEDEPNAIGAGPRKRRGRFPNLSRPLDVGRLTGIPWYLLGGIVTIPASAAYQVENFTIIHRLLVDNAPGSTSRLSGIESSSTARQFRVDIGTDGRLTFTASVGGTANVVNLTAPTSVVGTSNWYAIVVDVLHGEAILLTSDDEVSQTLSAPVASVSAALMAGYGAGHYQNDLRFYPGALDRERIRTLAEARDDDPGGLLAGWWRFDDGPSGTVVTDYAAVPNNGAIAGTLNVNYFWESSDLGDPEVAGRLMCATEGVVYNAEAELRNKVDFRYGFSDGPAPLDPGSGNAEWEVSVVKARGVPLVLTTDYTLPTTPAGGVLDLVGSGSGSEPITFDTTIGANPYPGNLLGGLLKGIGLRRGRIDEQLDIDPEAWEGLRSVYPWIAGLHWSGEAPTLIDVWSEALGGVGAHLRKDRAGRALPGSLLAPINPGPYGLGNFLEFSGSPSGGVVFPELPTLAGANVLNAVTIVMWVKVHNWTADPASQAATFPCYQEFLSTFSPDGTAGMVCGVSALRDGSLLFGSPGITSQLGDVGSPFSVTRRRTMARSGEWWLLAFKLTASTGAGPPVGNYQRTTYGAPLGAAAVTELNSQTVHGARTAGTQVRIGRGLAGSVAYVAIYDDDLVPADLTPMLTSPPPLTDALFYAALGEGAGSLTCVDQVSGLASGTISGARWCPGLRFDADRTTAGKVLSVRDARPMWRSVAEYKRNYRPMAESDIAAGVTDRAARAALRLDGMSESVIDRSIRSVYLRARDSRWEVPVLDAASARMVAELQNRRVAVGTLHAEVSVDQRIHGLRLLDEVHLRSTAAGLPNWTVWRIVHRAPSPLDNGGGVDGSGGTLALWGGFEE